MKNQVQNNNLLISNYFLQNKIGHAFLLVGQNKNINYNSAMYMARNLVCLENRIFDCQCKKCLQINNFNYPNLLLLGKNNETIKKEDIINIITCFSFSTLEKNNKKIYLINNIENATLEAVNSLLKFLEEPEDNTYAIITTQNLDNVLSTIISRCQLFYLSSDDNKNLIKLINERFPENKDDYELLLHCFDDYELLQETINTGTWNKIKSLTLLYLENFAIINSENYFLHQKLTKLSSGELKSFFLILNFIIKTTIANEDFIFLSNFNFKIQLKNRILKNSESYLFLIYKVLNSLSNNINKNLIIDYFLVKGYEMK